MLVNGHPQRTIWVHPEDPACVQIIDQRQLPHQWHIADLRTVAETARAIKDMWVRGAPLIGATAAYGMCFGVKEARRAADPAHALGEAAYALLTTRPTAINLAWAVTRQQRILAQTDDWAEKERLAWETAAQIVEEDVEICRQIGLHGLPLIEALAARKPGEPVNILTHCNAGWVACVDWGTATSPIYQAHNRGLPVHVWVDETRPRNQGARLTAWELAQHGVPHTVITDNAGGYLMQKGLVDLCLVGTDRTTYTGDVANKIGTYLKALAAYDNGVPFYVALPSTTIDWDLADGRSIPIETRDPEEVSHIYGWDETAGAIRQVRLTPADSPALNYAFDVTPARYVTGLITERGVCPASEAGIAGLFPRSQATS
jgi:methylthioribose-1-phosphate isomerase